jgi:hypothetical protein
MRSALSIIALVAACGGSDQPAPTAASSRYLASEPAEDNTPRERPAPPPAPRVEPPPPAPPVATPRKPPEPPEPIDGVYVPAYVRVNSAKLLDQRITVKGTVVWIYDCAADLAAQQPDKSREEIDKLVVKRPELCKRPHFYLGDRKTTPKERAIQVVEVPRPLRADERISLPKDQVEAWPKVPSIAVGQQVAVEGKWALNSPKGWANPDGLLVYGRLVP